MQAVAETGAAVDGGQAAQEGRASAAKLDLLREQIRKLQAAPRRYLAALRLGIPEIDGLLPHGGLPLGQAVELWGEAASGRTSLALRAVAAAHRELRLAAWVDGPGELYPPAAVARGVELEKLLIVRPRAPRQLAWTAQQLARSGAFACVVLDLTHTGVRLSLAEAKKLHDAAVHGGSLLLLLTPPDAPAEGALRLRVSADSAPRRPGPPLRPLAVRERPASVVAPLGVVEAETQAPGDATAVRVEILRSRSGGIGGHVEVEAGALLAGGGPPLRRIPATPAEGPLPAEPLTPDGRGPHEAPFRRVRSSELRNGARGIYGQRPGRDTRMPALSPSLGGVAAGSGPTGSEAPAARAAASAPAAPSARKAGGGACARPASIGSATGARGGVREAPRSGDRPPRAGDREVDVPLPERVTDLGRAPFPQEVMGHYDRAPAKEIAAGLRHGSARGSAPDPR